LTLNLFNNFPNVHLYILGNFQYYYKSQSWTKREEFQAKTHALITLAILDTLGAGLQLKRL